MTTEIVQWDFFLAYSSADKPIAESIYNLLSQHCKVFLDYHCLLLGDEWDQEIAYAQRQSRVTIVLISDNTNNAYYAREEIAAAVNMARLDREAHRVVPVFLDTPRFDANKVPYGLRLKHGLFLSSSGGVPGIVNRLVDLLNQINRLTKYTKTKPTDGTVTSVFKECFFNFNKAGKWIKNAQLDEHFLERAGSSYSKQLEQRYDLMRIFGMNRPVPLRSIYTRVNILEKITSRQRESVEDLQKYFDRDRRGFGIRRETRTGTEIVNKLSKIIVLGKPGSGKTTFLKYTALQASDGKLEKKLVPIYISLKNFSDSNKPLLNYLVEQFAICKFPDAFSFIKSMLEDGRCLILFDGLDEVTKSREDDTIRQISEFADSYRRNQIILSCRIAAYNYWFHDFTDVEVADFNEDQIRSFIVNWFGDDTLKGDLCWAELMRQPPIKELATIPLLLTLLCLAFDETISFPSNKAELYEEALDALLKKWDTSRSIKREEVYKNLSLRRKESMFSRIAVVTFENDQYFIQQRTPKKYIADFITHLPEINQQDLDVDSEAILKAIEAHHGIFVERARNIYSFSHLTFQEYFTAKYIVDNARDGTLKRLVEQHLMKEKWREVFTLTGGMLESADDFVLQINRKINSLVDQHLGAFLYNIHSNSKLLSLIPEFFKTLTKKEIPPACVRAFAIFLTLELTRMFDFNRKRTRSLFSSVTSSREAAHNLALSFQFTRSFPFGTARLTELSHLAYDADIDINFDYDFTHNIDRALKLMAKLNMYIKANFLLVTCLQSDSYVSTKTRQSIMEGL